MKKLINLVSNELIKIWKQLGYRIILILLVVVGILLPVLSSLMTIPNIYERNAETDYRDAEESEAFAVEQYKNKTDFYYSELDLEYFKAHKEAIKFFIDAGLSDSWKYGEYFQKYENLYITLRAQELAATGKYAVSEIVNSFFGGYYYPQDAYDEYGANPEKENIAPSTVDTSYAREALRALTEEILTLSEKDYIKADLDNSINQTVQAKQLAEIAYNKISSATDKKSAQAIFDKAQGEYKAAELKQRAWQSLYDNSVSPDDWKYKIVKSNFESVLMRYCSNFPTSESGYTGGQKMSYALYVQKCDMNRAQSLEAAELIVYHVEHDIPIPISSGSQNNGLSLLVALLGGNTYISTKAQFRDALQSFIRIATLVAIIIMAGIISSEHSSGTIRLLLIRPCNRKSIIISKLLALILLFTVLTLAISVIMLVECAVLFGIGDIFANDVAYINGLTIELPAILGAFDAVAVAALPSLLLISLASLVASLTKKNALSIVAPMLIYVFGGTVSLLSVLLADAFPNMLNWLLYAPTAYIDLTAIKPPLQELVGGMLIPFTTTGAILGLGIFYHILFIALFLFLTVLSFVRTQVKH